MSLRTHLFWPVNNCEQFAADFVDGRAQRSVKHLRVHIESGVHIRVARELRDHVAGHTPVV